MGGEPDRQAAVRRRAVLVVEYNATEPARPMNAERWEQIMEQAHDIFDATVEVRADD